jgi:hypothetical protein
MNEEDDNSQEFYKFIVAFGAKEGKEIKELSKKFGDGELTTMVFRLFMFAKILANSWDADQEFLILDTNKIKMYEQFIEKFQKKVDWRAISQYQKLSERFIYNNFEKIDLKKIAKHQELSYRFITFLYKNGLERE